MKTIFSIAKYSALAIAVMLFIGAAALCRTYGGDSNDE